MAKDPNWASAALVMHFDELVGGKFVDSSNFSQTVSAHVNAVLDTSHQKFGDGCIAVGYSGGVSRYVQITDAANLELGSVFTISFWLNTSSLADGNRVYVGKCSGPGVSPWCFLNCSGVLGFSASSNGGTWDIANDYPMGAPTLNEMVHIQLCADGTYWYPFVAGVKGTTLTCNKAPWDKEYPISLGVFGAPSGTYDAKPCYIDELYILPGICLNTANFTPPTGPYIAGVVAGNISNIPYDLTNLDIVATSVVTKLAVGKTTSGEAGTTYSVICSRADQVNVTASAKVDLVWSASALVAATGLYVLPTDTESTPFQFKATNIGSSPHHLGTTEPEWDTTVGNTTTSGDITLTCISQLPDQPICIGPKTPA